MAEAILSEDNQIELLEEARVALGVKPGDKILVVVHGSEVIVLKKPESYSSAIRGLAKNTYPEGYLEQERDSWK